MITLPPIVFSIPTSLPTASITPLKQTYCISMITSSVRSDLRSCYVCLLDLSVAFNIIDHNILIARLSSWIRIHSSVLSWFQSYPTSRSFQIKCNIDFSSEHICSCGVPKTLFFDVYFFTCIDWLIEHGLTSAPTHIGYTACDKGTGFYRSDDRALTLFDRLVIQTGLSLTRLTSPCYNNTTCMQILYKKIISHTEMFEKTPRDRDYNPAQYHYWTAVMTIFPLAPDQTTAQMLSSGVWGGRGQGHVSHPLSSRWLIRLNSVLHPHKHSIGYMGDGFYR